ncbi:MAG: response regulator [bacterium]|nr:response regulator [bacterium]
MAALTILLVEDNPDDEVLTVRELQKQHIVNEIIVVRDGVEALEYLFGTGQYAWRDVRDFPTVVLLDLKLPKVDGLEVLRRIRADDRTKHLPVVVLTSSDDQRDVVESYRLGANSYVCKPVNFNQFQEAVRHVQFYWLRLNEPPPSGESS